MRVAAVVGVGSATIAAAIGAGGLGEYIYRGLSMVDTTVILAGADSGGAARAGRGRRAAVARAAAVDAPAIAIAPRRGDRRRARSALVVLSSAAAARRSSGAIVVGSKNFTEQLVLGELLAQTIERDAGLPVDRRLNLGGTLICDRALITGDIDVYVEYTGTALTAVFHQPRRQRSRRPCSRPCATLYAKSGRTLLPPLGFNNTFAILVRGADARGARPSHHRRCGAVAPRWRAGFGYEFVERPDGYPRAREGLRAAVSGSAAGDGPDAQLSRAGGGAGRSDCRRRHRRA